MIIRIFCLCLALSSLAFVASDQAAAAQYCADYGDGAEEELTAVPSAWPADIPAPKNLTKIGGLLSTGKTSCTIDLYGRSDLPGQDYFESYSKALVNAGFNQVDLLKEADMLRGRFERGEQQIIVGSNIINAHTKRAYNEIGIVLTVKR